MYLCCICRLLCVLRWLAWWLLFQYFRPQIAGLVDLVVCGLVDCHMHRGYCGESGGVESLNATYLKVILPSVGSTGTSSVVEALRLMGYRSYHYEEITTFVPMLHRQVPHPEWFAVPLSRCRVEAISLEPFVDAFPFVLQVSPEAKVILTWRSFPALVESKIKKDIAYSLMGIGVGKDMTTALATLFLVQPFWTWRALALIDALTGVHSGILRAVYRKGDPLGTAGGISFAGLLLWLTQGRFECLRPGVDNFDRGVDKAGLDEESYLAGQDEIRRLASGRLFEFDVRRHGWAELSALMGRPSPPGMASLPHVRSMDTLTNDIAIERNKAVAAGVVCFLLAWHVLSAVLTRAVVLAAAGWLRVLTSACARGGRRPHAD